MPKISIEKLAEDIRAYHAKHHPKPPRKRGVLHEVVSRIDALVTEHDADARYTLAYNLLCAVGWKPKPLLTAKAPASEQMILFALVNQMHNSAMRGPVAARELAVTCLHQLRSRNKAIAKLRKTILGSLKKKATKRRRPR